MFFWIILLHLRMSNSWLLQIHKPPLGSSRSVSMIGGGNEFLEQVSEEISKATGDAFTGTSLEGGYGGGGGGATPGVIIDEKRKVRFFYKSASLAGFDMLKAEFTGVKEMYDTRTIRVPKPICFGTSSSNSFVVFEKVNLGGSGSAEIYGKKLAALHRCSSPTGMFGFHINNTIGATFQPNTWTESWADFWDQYRLGHMITLAKREGAVFPKEKQLRKKVRSVLTAHSCQPGLVHGDLWSGNQGFTLEGDPVIYDPATYYGDREVDIAMTKLFGSNARAFYKAYDQENSPIPGWELRETIYNSYHILNHFVLFGGGYLSQAQRMFDRILES